MKKKIGFWILLWIELISILGIYFVKGQIGAYIWSANVFIIAPIATLACLLQIIVLIVRIIKRKKIDWKFRYNIRTTFAYTASKK